MPALHDVSLTLSKGQIVTIIGANGLLSEFLSPNANRRTDGYGGSLENRMRFLLQAIAAIRRRTGAAFVVGVRINTDDYESNGVDTEMAQRIALRLRATGMVDYLNLSGMTASLYPAWIGDISAWKGVMPGPLQRPTMADRRHRFSGAGARQSCK